VKTTIDDSSYDERLDMDAAGPVKILSDAQLVMPEEIVRGHVLIAGERIGRIDTGPTASQDAINLGGDYLLPGLIDVHTDNLEKHAIPRPGVFWEKLTAAVAHDSLMVSAGITTVFDSLCVGALGKPERRRALPLMVSGLADAEKFGLLKADHFLHLRCDVTEPDLRHEISPYLDSPSLKLVTMLEDSTRRDAERFRSVRKRRGISDDGEIDAERIKDNRRWLAGCCAERQIVWGNHDDTRAWHIAEGQTLGMRIAEFPVTLEAAEAARSAGMVIVGGAPNVVAGQSHAGGLSMRGLAQCGAVHMLCSDYVPVSLLQAIFALTHDPIGLTLAAAAALVSRAPAALFGLNDRGSIAAGKRADLIQVSVTGGVPVVRRVWRGGRRVA
jgi:alpha-D-ribose 1-methylphosphonate 5-triphosphate diphosphatase